MQQLSPVSPILVSKALGVLYLELKIGNILPRFSMGLSKLYSLKIADILLRKKISIST